MSKSITVFSDLPKEVITHLSQYVERWYFAFRSTCRLTRDSLPHRKKWVYEKYRHSFRLHLEWARLFAPVKDFDVTVRASVNRAQQQILNGVNIMAMINSFIEGIDVRKKKYIQDFPQEIFAVSWVTCIGIYLHKTGQYDRTLDGNIWYIATNSDVHDYLDLHKLIMKLVQTITRSVLSRKRTFGDWLLRKPVTKYINQKRDYTVLLYTYMHCRELSQM